MAATLATVDAALFGALAALRAVTVVTNDLPFALVERFVGEVTRDTIQQVCTQFPACLLRFDNETSERDVDVVSGDSEEKSRGQWTVFVAVEDPRDPGDVVQGSSGVPGALAAAGKVLGVCNALVVAGTWHWRRIRYVDSRPVLTIPGILYVMAVRFESLRAAEQVSAVQTSVPLTSIRGDVNITGTAQPPPDPFETFDADT